MLYGVPVQLGYKFCECEILPPSGRITFPYSVIGSGAKSKADRGWQEFRRTGVRSAAPPIKYIYI